MFSQSHRAAICLGRVDISWYEREHLRRTQSHDGCSVLSQQNLSAVRSRFRDNRQLRALFNRNQFRSRAEPINERHSQLDAYAPRRHRQR